MIRARFKVNYDNVPQTVWPINHPYWITGHTPDGDAAFVVAYADDLDEILRNWPDAREIETTDAPFYVFTDRFPRPDWLRHQ